MRRPIVRLAVLGALLAACGVDPGSTEHDPSQSSTTPSTTLPATTTSTLPGNTSSGELGVIVPPDADGELPPHVMVGCRSGPYFEFSDLEEVVPLSEGDPGGVADAIEPFLSSEEGVFWPQEGWLILREGEDHILLVHDSEKGLSFMEVERDSDAWRWSGSQTGGPCPLQFQIPQSLNAVDWTLDPNGRPPSADSVEIDVLMTERECVSGQAIGDRLLEPEVVMTEDTVRIALAAEPPPGDAFDCQGNPETPYTVALPQPLGDREVVEGLAVGIDLEDYLP